MERSQTDRIKFFLAVVWLLFTVSLASWWLIFGLGQADRLAGLDHGLSARSGAHRMLVTEGMALIASLILGGTALLVGVRQEQKRHNAIEEFFAAFTHDLRTSLASLRLQVQSLEEDLQERGEQNPLIERLVSDSVRLQLQLDNSLFYANRRRGELFIERISLRETVDAVAREFTDLSVSLDGEVWVLADVRALEVVLRNLFQNALIHGRADTVGIHVCASTSSKVEIQIEDNGTGPAMAPAQLGRLFFRPTPRSGTGVGLYISRRLAKRMDGILTFSRGSSGLIANLELQRAQS